MVNQKQPHALAGKKPLALFTKYAIPQMIGLLLNSVYLIVDGIFIGNRLGREAMAAAAVAVPFIEFLIAISLAVATGAGVLISNWYGQKGYRQAKHVFNQAVWLMAGIGVLLVGAGLIWLNQLASLLGATPDIHAHAVTYLKYIVMFSPFLLFSFLLGALVRNDGRPKLAMAALAIGSLSNILLDYVFMYPLNMGLAGAALATGIGPVLSVLILLPHFLRKKGHLHFARTRVMFGQFGQILKVGLPSFLMEFTIGMVTLIYNYAIIKNGYGEIGLAAYLIMGYLLLIILTIFLGLAEGLQPVFSYFNGLSDDRFNQSLLRLSRRIFLAIGAACTLIVLLFSRNIIQVFAPGDTQLVDFTYQKSTIYFIGMIFAGFNILMISFWQSIQRNKSALTIALMRSVLVLPVLITILPQLFGRELIWSSHWITEAITACATLGLYVHSVRAYKQSLLAA